MKKSLGFIVALSLLFLASASQAERNLAADPHWRSLVLAPLGTTAPPPVHPAKSFGASNLMEDPDCSQFDFGECIYNWYPEENCCLAPPASWGVCRDACF